MFLSDWSSCLLWFIVFWGFFSLWRNYSAKVASSLFSSSFFALICIWYLPCDVTCGCLPPPLITGEKTSSNCEVNGGSFFSFYLLLALHCAFYTFCVETEEAITTCVPLSHLLLLLSGGLDAPARPVPVHQQQPGEQSTVNRWVKMVSYRRSRPFRSLKLKWA